MKISGTVKIQANAARGLVATVVRMDLTVPDGFASFTTTNQRQIAYNQIVLALRDQFLVGQMTSIAAADIVFPGVDV
jgi:hypothetical protein